MTCQEIQERLPGRVFDALGDDEAARLDQHLASCPACRAQLETVRASLGLLEQWQQEPPAPDLAGRTVARLSAEPVLPWWRRLACWLDRGLQSFAAHRPTPLTGLAAVAVAAVLLVPALSPNWSRGRSSGAVTACRTNLRLLRKTLDLYARDHQGHYPKRLEELSPRYVRIFPECPNADQDTYGPGYSPSADGLHYTLACHGDHHRDAGLPSDEPHVRK
jgi:hypothetical protein